MSSTRRLWKGMVQNYGARFTDQYGKSPSPEWSKVLDRLTFKEVDALMVKVRANHLTYPPTLGQIETLLPKKGAERTPSNADLLCDDIVKNVDLCRTQKRLAWNYFGQVVGYDDIGRPEYEIQGVSVLACNECGNPGVTKTIGDLNGRDNGNSIS